MQISGQIVWCKWGEGYMSGGVKLDEKGENNTFPFYFYRDRLKPPDAPWYSQHDERPVRFLTGDSVEIQLKITGKSKAVENVIPRKAKHQSINENLMDLAGKVVATNRYLSLKQMKNPHATDNVGYSNDRFNLGYQLSQMWEDLDFINDRFLIAQCAASLLAHHMGNQVDRGGELKNPVPEHLQLSWAQLGALLPGVEQMSMLERNAYSRRLIFATRSKVVKPLSVLLGAAKQFALCSDSKEDVTLFETEKNKINGKGPYWVVIDPQHMEIFRNYVRLNIDQIIMFPGAEKELYSYNHKPSPSPKIT